MHQLLRFLLILVIATIIVFPSCKKNSPQPTQNYAAAANVDCATITYSGNIAPLFKSKCNTSGCHDASSGNGNLTNYSSTKKFVDNGTIRKTVLNDKSMPEGGSLSATALGEIECWLDAGGPEN